MTGGRRVRLRGGPAFISLGLIGALMFLLDARAATPPVEDARPLAELTGFARLPADTFAPGPPSGRFVTPAPGLRLPFTSQPVQGFSALIPIPGRDGWFYALADNGYGTRINSPDFLLRIYRVRPEWGSGAAAGRVTVDREFIQLRDPGHKVSFWLVHEESADRLLTGADFDPESLVVDPDGSLWIGEEFGPFVLHADAAGVLLDAPIEVPGLKSPDHPGLAPPDAGQVSAATVRRSRGFEGLAASFDGARLYGLLEAGPLADPPDTTRIIEFDKAARKPTGREWRYQMEAPGGQSVTEMVPAWEGGTACGVGCERYLVIERDGGHGPTARFKRVYSIDLKAAGSFVEKRLLVDLLAIANPRGIGGFGTPFTFPFVTTEAIWAVGPDTVVLVNDNNYPEVGGRAPDARDDNEFIRVKVARTR